MDIPDNWTRTAGYRLDAAGNRIEYAHDDSGLVASVEAIPDEHDESQSGLEFVVVVFDHTMNPYEIVEQTSHHNKPAAQATLKDIMQQHR